MELSKVKLALLICMLVSVSVILTPSGGLARDKRPLFPIYVNEKGGYIDERGIVIISPRFEKVDEFSEGMAAVMSDRKWGYIDQSGSVLISPQFDSAGRFSEGRALVLSGGKYGYVNLEGKLTIPAQFQKAGDFFEGLARVRVNNKWGYINENGEVVIPAVYDYADSFHGGVAVVAKGNVDGTCRVAFIDKRGNQMFGKWFTGASRFSNGVAVVSNDSAGFSTIANGELTFDNYDLNSDGQKPVRFEVIDSQGRKLSEGVFQEMDQFSGGLAAVRVNDKYGYVNARGELVIEPQFDYADRFSEALALVSSGDERFYINQEGKRVFAAAFSDNRRFVNGLASVIDCADKEQPCKNGYVDKKGKVIWTPTR